MYIVWLLFLGKLFACVWPKRGVPLNVEPPLAILGPSHRPAQPLSHTIFPIGHHHLCACVWFHHTYTQTHKQISTIALQCILVCFVCEFANYFAANDDKTATALHCLKALHTIVYIV